jgi:hypothetical protein
MSEHIGRRGRPSRDVVYERLDVQIAELRQRLGGLPSPNMRDGASLPVEYPELPGEVTDVWTVSTWLSGAGFRWSPPAGWSTFPKSTAR